MGQAAIAFAAKGSEDGAAEGDDGVFLEQDLNTGAKGSEFAGLFGFGLTFGKFLSERSFDEAIFDADREEERFDGVQLLAEAPIVDAAEDGGDEGAKFVLVWEEGRGRKGEGERHNSL